MGSFSADPAGPEKDHPVRSPIEELIHSARTASPLQVGPLLESCRKYLLLAANRALDSDLRSKAGASDLVQDTFVEAHRDFHRFHGSTETELFAWLTKILANRIANNARRYHTEKRQVNRELPQGGDEDAALAELSDADAETPSALVLACEDQKRMQMAMSRLSEPSRQVILLRTWQRKTFAEIGKQMNRSPDGVRKLWARAVNRLACELRNSD
ncbi:MAG: sigma-70 family RNA polymerase sigma factor [Pirellulales bacterium]